VRFAAVAFHAQSRTGIVFLLSCNAAICERNIARNIFVTRRNGYIFVTFGVFIGACQNAVKLYLTKKVVHLFGISRTKACQGVNRACENACRFGSVLVHPE